MKVSVQAMYLYSQPTQAHNPVRRTVKEVNKLSSKSLENWPTYAATMKKITHEGGE